MVQYQPPPTMPEQSLEELPVNFQHNDSQNAFAILQTGESQALVGVGSSGKSNFVKHIARPQVKKFYIRDRRPYHYLIVPLNPHQLIKLEQSALDHCGKLWPGYELLLNRLRHAINDTIYEPTYQPIDAADMNNLVEIERNIHKLYGNMFSNSPLMAQSAIRRVEDAMEEVLPYGDEVWRVAFIFDELEEFFRLLPPEFFQSLRGLRDDRKRRLMYLTTSRHTPTELLHNLQDRDVITSAERAVLEGFTELFHDFTYYLRPLDDQSAEYNFRRFHQRYKVPINPQQKHYLRVATGQHMGLMRRGYIPAATLDVSYISSQEQFNDHLITSNKIRKDCETLYESLSDSEKNYLMQGLGGRVNPNTDIGRILRAKHLINENGFFTIPVLLSYMRWRIQNLRQP